MDYSSMAGASVQGTMGIIQGVIGYYQRKKAAEMEKSLVRPTLDIPDTMQGYMTDLQKRAYQGMPEEQRQRYLDNIARAQAYGIAASAGRGGMLQGVAQSQMAANDANANLATMDAQARMQNQSNYSNAQLNYANFQNDKYLKEFEYNKNQPYQNKAAAIRAMYGAGMQNGAQGLQTVADSGATFAGGSSGGGGQQAPVYNPDYTGYGARGTVVQPINTIPAQQIPTTAYSPQLQTKPTGYYYNNTPYNTNYMSGSPYEQGQ